MDSLEISNSQRLLKALAHCMGIAVLVGLSFWVRFAHLGEMNLYNDEYYQFEAAVGYLETGEYARYNFETNTIGESYTRAWPYTWQIAQSMRIFGVSEQSARIPGVIWGVLLVVLVFGIARLASGNWLVAYSAGFFIAFDPLMIELSRFTRMYAMLLFFTTLAWYALYRAMQNTERFSDRLFFLSLTGLATFLAGIVFSEMTIAVLVGAASYIGLRGIWYVLRSDYRDYWYGVSFIIGLLGVVLLFALQYKGYDVLPLNAITIRQDPHWIYLSHLFASSRWMWLSVALSVVGLFFVRSFRSYSAYAAVTILTIMVYFIFFSRRFEAYRYIAILLPILGIYLSITYYKVLAAIWRKVDDAFTHRTSSIVRNSILCTGFFFGFIVFALPSIAAMPSEAHPLFTSKATADKSAEDYGRGNISATYRYIERQWRPGQIVYVIRPRWYYWREVIEAKPIPMRDLGLYQELSLEDFTQLLQEAEAGGIIAFNQTHRRHLTPEIKQYMHEHLTYVDAGLKNVDMYTFLPAQVAAISTE